jgi:outer membrane protein assembly factor BamB
MRETKIRSILMAGICLTLAVAAAEACGAGGRSLVELSGVKGGLVVYLGRGDASIAGELKINRRYSVQELISNPINLEASRGKLRGKGIYGAVTVDSFDGKHLPYADELVNLFIIENNLAVPKDEVVRALAPMGVALWLDEKGDVAERFKKPWPNDIDEWTHYLHGPANNATAKDLKVGLPRSPRWFAGPRWNRSHEELASMSALVSAKGRVFYIVDKAPLASIRFPSEWKLVARDAFNGILLWSRTIPKWIDHMRHFRTGPAHLPKRLTAVDDKVYVTLGLDAPVSALDAATGKTIKTYDGTEGTEEITVCDGVLYLLVGPSEFKRFGAGLFDRGEPKPSPKRFLVAIEGKTGKELWRRNAGGRNFILPLGVALANGKLFFHSVRGLGCLDSKTGTELWMAKRGTIAKRYAYATSTLVATDDVVLLADRKLNATDVEKFGIASDWIDWGVHGWNLAGFPKNARSEPCDLTAYDTATGEKLWSVDCHEGYNSPVDVFVINGMVWPGPFEKKIKDAKGYDLKTGELKRKIPCVGDPVGMAHHRCYRDKASLKYILAGRDGVEIIDLVKGWIRNNSWVRGVCQYGVMPCNGMIYAPPDPCACHLKTRLSGFVALSSDKLASVGKTISEKGRLEKGPAYASSRDSQNKTSQWPTYRGSPDRSGFAPSSIASVGAKLWSVSLGGVPSQAVFGDGKVFVSTKRKCAVHAVDAGTGEKIWTYSAGAAIDGAPTFKNGKIYFGSADGWIYCVDAATGSLAWRFMAAPERRSICVDGEVESSWPVHGAVLALDDGIYLTAGRNTYIDGGIYFYRLDPESGKLLDWSVLSNINPKTEKQIGPPERKFDSDGATSDLLSSDGISIFMNYMRLDKKGERIKQGSPHLFSPTGLVSGDKWFVRTYWTLAEDVEGAGYGGWQKTALDNPSGRIVCFGGGKAYGYGRKRLAGARAGHRCDDYVVFAMDMTRSTPKEKTRKQKNTPRLNKTGRGRQKSFLWTAKAPIIVKAMLATPNKLLLAGVPDLGNKTPPKSEPLAFENPKEALKAFKGERGAFLQLASSVDGALIPGRIELDAPPVFDGLSMADGKIFVSLENGEILCFETQ